jgi:hypothetical protein
LVSKKYIISLWHGARLQINRVNVELINVLKSFWSFLKLQKFQLFHVDLASISTSTIEVKPVYELTQLTGSNTSTESMIEIFIMSANS